MGLTQLSEVLWTERHLLEVLLFKLDTQQMVLSSGRTRWLTHASREVETLLGEIRKIELARAVHADAVAEELGIGPGPSLKALADAAPEPWKELLGQHREAFVTLTSEIAQISNSNRELLAMSHRATQETLMSLGESSATYNDHGSITPDSNTSGLIDRTM